MKGRSVLYALAVVVLMGGMVGVALAEGVEQLDTWQIREAMETGSFPDRSMGSSDAYSNEAGDEPTVEAGGVTFRPEIDAGP